MQALVGNRSTCDLLRRADTDATPALPTPGVQRARTKQKQATTTAGPKNKVKRPGGVAKGKKAKKAKAWNSTEPVKVRVPARAIITGGYSSSGQLIAAGGKAHYGDSEFRAIGSEGYGQGMYVTIPDWNHTPDGSPPSSNVRPAWWPTGDDWWTRYMVQGHLLNENLGGPGTDLRNLAPISKVANKEHEQKVESVAKHAAIKQGGPVIYSVDVVPGPPVTDAFKGYEADTNEPNRGLVAKLPKGFSCELQDGDGNGLVSWTVINRI